LAESRGRVELEVFSLIDAPVTGGHLRWTASPPASRHVVPNPVCISPVARQVRMPGQPWRGRRLVYRHVALRPNGSGDLPRGLDGSPHTWRHRRNHIHVARLRLFRRQVADYRAVLTLDPLAGVKYFDRVQRVIPVFIAAVGEFRGCRSLRDHHLLRHVLRIERGCPGRPWNAWNPG